MGQYHHGPSSRAGWRHAPRPRPRHRDRRAAHRSDQLGARRRRASASATPTITARARARTGVTSLLLAEDAYPRRWRPAARCSTGWGSAPASSPLQRVGHARDAGLPDLDHAARPGLRRGLRARARRGTRRSPTTSCIPVVGECDDSFLNDCRRMQVTADDVRAAHDAALRLARLGDATGRGRGRVPAPGCPAWASRAASARRRGSPRRPHGGGPAADQLRRARRG